MYDVKYQKEKNPIQQIAEYIRKNYEKDINLRDISAQFYLSREHISRRFKQEFNETITDYITKIRMEKAKNYWRTLISASMKFQIK
ncbi:AraC family transcriptional regulator [Bacillus sp. N9]